MGFDCFGYKKVKLYIVAKLFHQGIATAAAFIPAGRREKTANQANQANRNPLRVFRFAELAIFAVEKNNRDCGALENKVNS